MFQTVPLKTNAVINTFGNDLTSGKLNSLKHITQKCSISINSKYRNSPITSTSSDFQITIPTGFTKKVVSMELTSMEFPNQSYYMFSDDLRNNIFWLKLFSQVYEIKIPNGNYETLEEFFNCLNSEIDKATGMPQLIVCSVDPISLHTKILVSDPKICFNLIFYDEVVNTFGVFSTLGWQLGFRLPVYSSFVNLSSECMVDINRRNRNLYLSVNDYQYNNNNNNLVLLGQNNMLDDYILAKYTLTSSTSSLSFTSSESSLQSFQRIYNGPVNLTKLGIRVYNDNGVLINMNGLDFSFTLELTILYENFNF